jgi:hypothetical protein
MSETNFSLEPELLNNATIPEGSIRLSKSHNKTAINPGEEIVITMDQLSHEISQNAEQLPTLLSSLSQQIRTEVTLVVMPLNTVRTYYVNRKPEDGRLSAEKAGQKLDAAKKALANTVIQWQSIDTFLNLPDVKNTTSQDSFSEQGKESLDTLNQFLATLGDIIGQSVEELKDLYQTLD